jgi:hypothetical protein
MRNGQYIKSRLLIVAAFALPAFVFINGCKSTTTSAATVPGVTATDDAALVTRAKQALVADSGLRSLPISVATYRGVVQLSGYVDSESACRDARRARGAIREQRSATQAAMTCLRRKTDDERVPQKSAPKRRDCFAIDKIQARGIDASVARDRQSCHWLTESAR